MNIRQLRGWLLRQEQRRPPGVALTAEAIADEEALAAVMRITGGNFRLLQRLLTQIARLLEINELAAITTPVVQAARESLVIGAGINHIRRKTSVKPRLTLQVISRA